MSTQPTHDESPESEPRQREKRPSSFYEVSPHHMGSPHQGRPAPANFIRREWKVRSKLWCAWSVVFEPDVLLIDMRYAAAPPRGAGDVEGDVLLVTREIEQRVGIVVGKLDVIVRVDHNTPLGVMGQEIDGPLTLHARPAQSEVENVGSFVPQLVVVTVHGHRRHEGSSQSGVTPPASGEQLAHDRAVLKDLAKRELTTSVRRRDGDECRYCGTTVDWTDKRGSRGGSYYHLVDAGFGKPGYYVVACRKCCTSLDAVDAWEDLRESPVRPVYGEQTRTFLGIGIQHEGDV